MQMKHLRVKEILVFGRPLAVVLLSSEPRKVSDNAYNYAKASLLVITPFSDRARSTIPKKNKRLLAVYVFGPSS